eukprot:TRINITY_DN6074_c0_g1_i1.p1 TRINITY_DN6074_c0_g1~~TRINITY_DN6074_c0_g1_i1.p1  ORF type:complete len:399 (-),score=89.87 TRINITY_DN6074_c0_g1_i1:62-1258(-)
MVTAKIIKGDEIRRVTFDEKITYEELTEIVSKLFRIPGPINFKYEDDEKDLITATSTLEIQEAIRVSISSGSVLRLFVQEATAPSTVPPVERIEETVVVPIEFHGRGCGNRRPLPFHPPRGPFVHGPFVHPPHHGGHPHHGRPHHGPHHAPHHRPHGPPHHEHPHPIPPHQLPENVHRAFCDGCKKRIAGIRYKCNTCPDFDFCQECRNQEHMGHSFTQIDDPKSIVHRALCDNCDNWIVGNRYKCTQCPDYDLCSGCKSKEGIHDHPFQEITTRWRPFAFHQRRWGCPAFRMAPQPPTESPAQADVPETSNDAPIEPVEKPVETTITAEPAIEKPIEEPVAEVIVEETKADSEPEHPLKIALQSLESMGFNDRSVTIPLLISKNMDIAEVVASLLDL